MQLKYEFIKNLREKYGQKPCFVLSAGPSLGEIDTNEWREIMRECLVVSIKQAITLFPDETDILLTNDYNLIDYAALKRKSDCMHIHLGEINVDADAIYHLDPERKSIISSISFCKDFNRNDLKQEFIASGPGIVYELAFPLLINLNIRRCIIAGWDMTPAKSGHNEHFYKQSNVKLWKIHDILRSATGKKSFAYKRARKIIGKRTTEKISCWIQQKLYNWAAFLSTGNKWRSIGKDTLFNSEKINSEMDLSRNASGEWYDYLESHGLEICIASSLSTADKKIKRITSPVDARKYLGL